MLTNNRTAMKAIKQKSRHTTPHHIPHDTPHHFTPQHITSQHITTQHITTPHTTSHHNTTQHTTSHRTTLHYMAWYHIFRYDVILSTRLNFQKQKISEFTACCVPSKWRTNSTRFLRQETCTVEVTTKEEYNIFLLKNDCWEQFLSLYSLNML